MEKLNSFNIRLFQPSIQLRDLTKGFRNTMLWVKSHKPSKFVRQVGGKVLHQSHKINAKKGFYDYNLHCITDICYWYRWGWYSFLCLAPTSPYNITTHQSYKTKCKVEWKPKCLLSENYFHIYILYISQANYWEFRNLVLQIHYTYIILLQDLQRLVDIVQVVYSHTTPLPFLNVNE